MKTNEQQDVRRVYPTPEQCTRNRNKLALEYAQETAQKNGVPVIVFDERLLTAAQVDAARNTEEQPCAALFDLCKSLENAGFCEVVRLFSEQPKPKTDENRT